MRKECAHIAIDFGASGGRVMIGLFDGQTLRLEEIHRFPNEPVWISGSYHWDFLRLVHELKTGLKKVAKKQITPASIGIDTWGVDYGLLDEYDGLLSNPYHYRDARTNNIIDEVTQLIDYDSIYAITGIQYMQFNTLYQLFAEHKYRPRIFEQAKTLLFMPDLFGFVLTGQKYNEYSIASTSQLLDTRTRCWSRTLLEKLELPARIFSSIVQPGQVIGYLSEAVQQETGLGPLPVIAVGSHDTASAVAGIPLTSGSNAYLICGTWSLLGMELDSPIVSNKSLYHNFTNEGGVENKIRFLKNINGLWLIQQLQKHWSEQYCEVSYPEISQAAATADNPYFWVPPDAVEFRNPSDMIAAIQKYCQKTGQGTPKNLGELARAAYNGITAEYKHALEGLKEATGQTIDVINMVGGGIQDTFLCQLTANITGKQIITGPVEASVLGNITVQMTSLGEISGMNQGRALIKASFPQREYFP